MIYYNLKKLFELLWCDDIKSIFEDHDQSKNYLPTKIHLKKFKHSKVS